MNTTAKSICQALFAIALFFASTTAHSQDEAYLGVNGYITSVSRCAIIETTTRSNYTNTAPQTTMGFKIRCVQQNSPAAYAGLRSGDVLIEAHGNFINSYSSLKTMRQALARTDSMMVFYLRNGNVQSTYIGGSDTITTTVRR